MTTKTIGPMDSVISCYAYVNATNALGLLQSHAPESLPPEMLATLDNFIKVMLFSDNVYVHPTWVELFDTENAISVYFHPEPRYGGAGKEIHEHLISEKLFKPLPLSNSEISWDKMLVKVDDVDPNEWPGCIIDLEILDSLTCYRQEILSYDLIILEEAIRSYGIDRFKPVFPGEHMYLGYRGTEHIELSLADLVPRRLRDSATNKIRELNTQQSGLGALSLPEIPPIFLVRLLSDNKQQKDLAKDLVKLRNSRQFCAFRKSAAQCHEMLKSSDVEMRTKASKLITSLLEGDIDDSVDYLNILDRTIGIAKAITSALSGKVLDPIKEVVKLTSALQNTYNDRATHVLREFGGTKTNPQILGDFVEKEFGDRVYLDELETISKLLSLPENPEDWKKLDYEFNLAGSMCNSQEGLNGRPVTISFDRHFTSADREHFMKERFGK